MRLVANSSCILPRSCATIMVLSTTLTALSSLAMTHCTDHPCMSKMLCSRNAVAVFLSSNCQGQQMQVDDDLYLQAQPWHNPEYRSSPRFKIHCTNQMSTWTQSGLESRGKKQTQKNSSVQLTLAICKFTTHRCWLVHLCFCWTQKKIPRALAD